MRVIPLRVLATLGLVVALASLLGAPAGASQATERYIVKLAEPPLASYRGGIDGLAPTSPAATGAVKLDPTSAASKAYLEYLSARQTAVLTAVTTALGRTASPTYTYRYAYNGFALDLTAGEAERVGGVAGVAGVQKDYVRQLLTDAGPAWIGAPAVWDGSSTGAFGETKGEGVVVGVIDTGVNHDHPSFADVGGDGFNHRNPRGHFYGLCDPVTGKPFCNDKLIGVWDFTGTTPLDDNQHGSHTASTAAGNVVDAKLATPTVTIERRISGVAPHANLITYKACIAVGCMGASLTAAIDQATADAVDVVNYSIGGGPSNPWGDSDSEAFLAAREAGVFVAASAGNDGSRPETVGSPANAPWLLSVAASTHNRTFINAVAGATGGATTPPGELRGAGVTSGYGPAPIVHAAAYGDALCSAPFAPGTFKGEIVICQRGVNPRVEKGSNVKTGGAGGMVLVNSAADGESTVGDAHNLPAVHLGYTSGKKLADWVQDGGTGHTVRITGSTLDEAAKNGDVMAGFSSRGPNKPVPGVIKPDVTAPGVDVLAAVHTTNPTAAPEYGILSGTSMSGPHAAGAAALLRALHGNWTPAEIHSALVSTAWTAVRDDDGVRAADAYDVGGGRVDLTKAGRAGLTLDQAPAGFTAADPEEGGDPTTLNLATLGHGDCDGICSWTRTVKSRAGSAVTWRAVTSGPRESRITVSPAEFTLGPNGTQTLTITADVRKLSVGQTVFGDVRLVPSEGGVPETRLPIAVQTAKPVPVNVVTNTTHGATIVTTTSKAAISNLQTVISGLTQGNVSKFLLEQDPTPTEGPYDAPLGTKTILVDVPANSRFLATEIVSSNAVDLDLFVGRDTNGDGKASENEELCKSASDGKLESCRLSDLEGGKYWILVENWLGVGASNVELATAVIPGASVGNLTATAPKSVPANTPFEVTVTWKEPAMDPGEVWFGLVELGTDRKHPDNAKALFVKINRV